MLQELQIEKVVPSKTNPRKSFNEAALKELAESIKRQGIISPILVRPTKKVGGYEIVTGERRFRAAQLLGLLEIPAIVREISDEDALEIQVIENLQRQDVHPLEEAEGYEQLIKVHGYQTADDIAAKIGKSKSYVYARMKLCALIPEARKAFFKDQIPASTALLIARVPENLQKECLKDILQEHSYHGEAMSYCEAAAHIQERYMCPIKGSSFSIKDKDLYPEAGACTMCPKLSGNEKDLFPDVKKADVCSDPTCYSIKVVRHNQQVMAKAEKAGHTVIKEKGPKEIFAYGGSQIGHNSGYVALSDRCWEDSKERNYKALLSKSDVKLTYVVDSLGKIHEIIRKDQLAEALKKAGHTFRVSEKESDTSSRSDEARAERKKMELKKACIPVIMTKVMEKFSQDKTGAWWRIFAEKLLEDCGFEAEILFCKRRGLNQGGEIRPKMTKALKETPDKDLPAFCFELVMVASYFTHSDSYGGSMLAAAKLYRVDLKAIEKEVAATMPEKKVKKVK
jgi:ParB/RepB/Spo0J family partition protein